MIGSTTLLAFGEWIGGKLGEKGFDKIYTKLTNIDRKDKFYQVVRETSEQLEIKYPQILGGDIFFFFQHEEVFNELINLLFLHSKINTEVINRQFDIETLPNDFIVEFIEKLKFNLLHDEEFQGILSDKEIYLTCVGITKEVSALNEITTLSYDEIIKIKKILEDKFLNKFNLENFKVIYFQNAVNNLSQVNFIGLGIDMDIKKGRRKKISQIFIEPYFEISEPAMASMSMELLEEIIIEHENRLLINYRDIFSFSKNVVVLGNPGSGKSFLLKSIICSIINHETDKFVNKEIFEYIPFRIELRKYLAFKKSNQANLLKHLADLLGTEYGIYNILETSLDDILKNEKTLFLFDGLDEIFNPIEKFEIKNDIENFHKIYNKALSLTTSRIEGYDEAVFDPEIFNEFVIENFDDEQIEEYLNRWYDIEEDNKKIRDEEIADFLSKKSELDEELIKNPLLLSLIVILYRNNLKLPESKLEIYKSCTSTLVDKWDSSKDLFIDLDKEILKRKETILADLAYWQYAQLSSDIKNNKITYERAKNVVGKSLLEKLKIVDEYTVDLNAEKFMIYALKRSIYFDNNFTHKTFLEYYTAYWIYTNIEKKHKKKERDDLISTYINNTFWHIVLELLLNLIDKDQADDEIMDEVFMLQLKSPRNSISFLLSALPSIQNISNEVKEELFIISINTILLGDLSFRDKYNRKPLEFERLSKYYILDGYKDILAAAFKKVYNTLKFDNEYLHFYYLYCESIMDASMYFKLSSSDHELIAEPKFLQLAEKDERLYKYYAYYFNSTKLQDRWLNTLQDYVDKFGLKKSYNVTSSYYGKGSFSSIYKYFLSFTFYPNNILNIEQNLLRLKSIGFSFEMIFEEYVEHSRSYFYLNETYNVEAIDKIVTQGLTREAEILLIAFLLTSYVRKQNLSEEINGINFSKFNNQKITYLLNKYNIKTSITDFIKKEYKLKNIKIDSAVLGTLLEEDDNDV